MHLRKSITRETTSSGDSSTMNFCPFVSDTTVSGVTSTCSIRSELSTSGTWFMRVSRITSMSFVPQLSNRHLPIILEAVPSGNLKISSTVNGVSQDLNLSPLQAHTMRLTLRNRIDTVALFF